MMVLLEILSHYSVVSFFFYVCAFAYDCVFSRAGRVAFMTSHNIQPSNHVPLFFHLVL
jgi:hypothetical protein